MPRTHRTFDAPVKPPPGRDALSPQEAAWLFSCSTATVRRLVRTGELPSFRLGRAIRINRAELDRYAERNRRSA